jgi:hypothetical protein
MTEGAETAHLDAVRPAPIARTVELDEPPIAVRNLARVIVASCSRITVSFDVYSRLGVLRGVDHDTPEDSARMDRVTKIVRRMDGAALNALCLLLAKWIIEGKAE